MADRCNLSYKAGQVTGQAQVKKDEIIETAKQEAENVGGFMQQTGEQVKHMAQSATDAVKNAMGFGGASDGTTATDATKP